MKDQQKVKNNLKKFRKRRVRAKAFGRADLPRFNVFRSLKHISVQLIDDEAGRTLVSASDKELKTPKGLKRVEIAFKVGQLVAAKATEAGIKRIVFDRAGYKYHGRVKAVAEGARQGGLKF